jgi:hypothetical protein
MKSYKINYTGGKMFDKLRKKMFSKKEKLKDCNLEVEYSKNNLDI